MPCLLYEPNLTRGLIPALWRDPAGRGDRVSSGKENGVVCFASQLLPFLSSLTDTVSQDLLQHKVNVPNVGSTMSKKCKKKPQTNLS